MNLWSLYCKNKKEYNGTFVDFVKDFSNCREDFGSKKIIYSKTTDLLHSDMIGSEVLTQISMIAKQTNINMTIPQNTLKELPSK